MRNNTTDEILEVLREMPGLTMRETCEFLSHIGPISVGSTLSRLATKGVLVTGSKMVDTKAGPRKMATYSINTDPSYVPPPKKRKLKEPTENGYRAQIDELKAKISELEAWKASALARHPDLGVPPSILKARAIVAAELKAGDDYNLAEQVLLGRKDDTLLVRVTAKALEETVDE